MSDLEGLTMTANEWVRVEGMIIAGELDPHDVANDLATRGVLAELEWFERSPHLLGLSVAAKDGKVGVIGAGGSTELTPGDSVDDLAQALAQHFAAEVRLGGALSDHLPQGASPLSTLGEDSALDESSRIVEIGRTPASSVPLLAALEGVDLADIDLPDGARALLAELPPERAGWNFGDLPLVTLSVTGEELQAFLVTDDHLEHVVSHNWGMHHLMVPGSLEDAAALPQETADLVGDREELETIAQAVPGADVESFVAAATAAGPWAVRDVARALGLPAGVADFLVGITPLASVPTADLHLARGISNAIGRSVDIMLTEPDSPGFPLWDAYQTAAVQRPWIVRVGATVEAAVGATLIASAVRAERPRSGWLKLGAVVGSLMIVDSVAELSLAKYLGLRAERRSARD